MADVIHVPNEQRFVSRVEGYEATLAYERLPRPGADLINFTSTFVPPELRGKGIAEHLVRVGLQWAKEQGYEIEASCWYVAKFLR